MLKKTAFNEGNSRAIFIPEELAYACAEVELDMERVGEEQCIRQVNRSLASVLDKFARFPSEFMAGGREACEQAERFPPKAKKSDDSD